ncbi:MAG: hypothetical protein GWN61_04130, partial [candidate division Zixibacteria bacterium]|nr:hypothetical protein [candidate division Zixibacteria bacterium]NIR63262.1 hypothetical protein [candidate division Zixibacteria bacterium]NIS17162.1 hypothetical protein [candidate division Zixibacteria bacterium]NIS45243.1 hypothetical protein [candidate division Zixibacteria bacterium]NIU13385.1 hypothetical protein [candidate division Zixibacteria bacterium]
SWGHVAWGIQFQLGYFQLENNDMSIVSIGPTLGYYLGGPNSTFYPYIEAGFSGGRVMLNDIFADDDAVTWEMEISMGILRFITPRVAIELAIDYSHGYTDYDKGDEFYESRMGLSLGLSVFNY